ILHRRQLDADFATEHGLEPHVLAKLIHGWQHKLLAARAHRVRPGLDDKVLTGWNALMLTGLLAAYRAFGEAELLELALRNAEFIQQNLRHGPRLYRTWKNGRATINGFLEDYALVIEAYTSLYVRGKLAARSRGTDELPGALTSSSLPLLEGRDATTDTTIYVCRNRACQLPVQSVSEALGQLALAEQ
nr:hypothetical protein [Tanacetum cinerariifolium]